MPADAWPEVKPLARWVLSRAGGAGCVREFCDAVWEAKRLTNLFSLDGRVAIVTGGAGQLGSEIARGLEARGATRRGLRPGGGADLFRVDVTDRGAIEQAAEEVVATGTCRTSS